MYLRRLPTALMLALGACAERHDPGPAMQDSLAAMRASLAAIGTPAPATTPAAPPPPATPAASLAPPPRPGSPRQRGNAPPASSTALIGADARTLLHMLGEPSLRRTEGSAEVWLYTAEGCRLDIILYNDHNTPRVSHAAARAASPQPMTESACLDAIAHSPTLGEGV